MTNLDGAVPLIYWVSAECPVLLLGISLPTMWPLLRKFRHAVGLGTTTNDESSRSRTHGSRNDRAAVNRKPDITGYEAIEFGTYHTMDSQSDILKPIPAHVNHFTATVSGGNIGFNGPTKAIRVENEYRVDR